jgi:hypothetical protein
MKIARKARVAATGTVLAAMLGTGIALPATAEAAPATNAAAVAPAATLPVTGTSSAGSFTGSLSNLSTSVVNGALQLTGNITGTLTNASGATTAVSDTFTTTLALTDLAAGGSCTILTLDLGPLHLDLLGLVVDLAPVHLTITAQQGPGNLLGNLLCAVAGLLDNGGPLTGISALLNRLLAGLGLA